MTKQFPIRWTRNTLAALLLLAASTPAVAQKFAQPGSDPRVSSPQGLGPEYSGVTGSGVGLESSTPEYGWRTGDFVIQPRLFVEMAYDTNFFRTDTRTTLGEETGVFELRLKPGLGIYNPEFSKIALSATADLDVRLPLTGGDAATSHMNVGADISLAVSFFPKGVLTFVIYDDFHRKLYTRPAAQYSNANLNSNSLGADFSLHPGGKALDFTLGYRFKIVRYDEVDQLAQDSHLLRFLASWRFYPMNYFFLESTVDIVDWPGREPPPDVPEAEGAGGSYLSGYPFKIYLGLSGYFTERIALLLRLGYGNSLLDGIPASEDFNMLIAMAQLSFRFSEKSVLHVGGAYDFEPIAFGGYRSFGRAYLAFDQRIADLALLHVDVAFDYRLNGDWTPYPYKVNTPDGSEDFVWVRVRASHDNREDMRLRAGLVADFDLHRIVGLSVGYRLDMVFTEYWLRYDDPIAGIRRYNYVGYHEHRVFLSVNIRY